jgi:hypothetical protein
MSEFEEKRTLQRHTSRVAHYEKMEADYDASDLEKIKEFNQLSYKEQALKFLNIYWDREPLVLKDSPDLLEEVWNTKAEFVKLDKSNGEEGKELSEFDAHRILEKFGSTMTVQQFRKVFQDIDVDHDHQMSLLEYLIFKHQASWKTVANAPVSNSSKVNQAQQYVSEAQKELQNALTACEKAKEELALALDANRKASDEESKALEKEASAKEAEEEVNKAKLANEESLNEVKRIEKEKEDRIKELEEKSTDQSLGIVKRNRAKAELEQAKQEDSLPLRKAKISQEAAVRRLNKAVKTAASETAIATEARRLASEAKELSIVAAKKSEEAKTASETAVEVAEKAFQDAEKFLEEVKSKFSGSSEGSLWWMDRELAEAKRYLPKSKFAKLEASLKLQKQQLGDAGEGVVESKV